MLSSGHLLVKRHPRKYARKLIYGDKTHHHKRRKGHLDEAGLYHLTFRSNKSKAKEFAIWVCETVLPEIRQAVFFRTLKVSDRINISKQIECLSLQLTQTKNAFRINDDTSQNYKIRHLI